MGWWSRRSKASADSASDPAASTPQLGEDVTATSEQSAGVSGDMSTVVDAVAGETKRNSAQGNVEIPGKKEVEVIKVNNPENYEDDTNQTGQSIYEMKIQDSYYTTPNRPRSKAYQAAKDADLQKKNAKQERKAERASRRSKKKNKNPADPVELIPHTVPWALENTKKLGILNLSKMELERVPDEIFESMPGTARIINVSFNRMTTLDTRICDYVLVQRLIANGNLLTSIPQNILRMTALKKLDLASNRLTALPDAFGSMRFLEHVDLSQNLLTELPPSFASLQLTALSLSRNKFSTAPMQVASMEWLMDLDLSGNQLTSVPEEYASLTQLIGLNLESNKLSDFPNSVLQFCTELVTLRLRDNPITMTILEEKQSFIDFSERRRVKLKRQIDAGAITENDLLPANNNTGAITENGLLPANN